MLPSAYQQFIHLSRYARWSYDNERRESWPETVRRYFDFFIPYLAKNHGYTVDPVTVRLTEKDVVDLRVMPSMRCMMTAGPALERDHVAGYNCAYRPIEDIRSFDEILFILMCGTGIGFSTERQYVNKLPPVPETLTNSNTMIVVRDSKRGWAEAYRELVGMLFAGRIPKWNVDGVRPTGARLKTFGGRASGPGPLVDLFEFTIRIFQTAQGRKLNSIECYDLVCKIGDCVVVGGVRRSALLNLSNLSDQRMRDAKSGQWWETEPQRELSNNSVAYTERPEVGQFMQEWIALYGSKSGERGIFNREAARVQAMSSGRRLGYSGDDPIEFGTNPCSEIILRPQEFCNLTEVVARAEDTIDTLARKVRVAAMLGTWQACLTDFRYLTSKWKENCEEERLLGVSITGIMDCPLLHGDTEAGPLAGVLETLQATAVDMNAEWAERLGIPQAAAVTCVKPSGTVSQLVNASSGIHPRHAHHYVRRVQQDNKDPLTQFMIDQGFPHEPHATKPDHMTVFSFPQRAPNGGTRDEWTAIRHLELWKTYQDHWCEHKPSVTINVREEEWPSVGAWVWEHFDDMSGVAFLPYSEHSYRQAPYEEISDERLVELENIMPIKIDWDSLSTYESEDYTTGSQELACVGDLCEVA